MILAKLFALLAGWIFFQVLYKSGERAGLFDPANKPEEPEGFLPIPEPLTETIEPTRNKNFVRLEIAPASDDAALLEYDAVFHVGGFASYRGQIGQVVMLKGRMAKLEIFSRSGKSTESDIIDVPISELRVVTQM